MTLPYYVEIIKFRPDRTYGFCMSFPKLVSLMRIRRSPNFATKDGGTGSHMVIIVITKVQNLISYLDAARQWPLFCSTAEFWCGSLGWPQSSADVCRVFKVPRLMGWRRKPMASWWIQRKLQPHGVSSPNSAGTWNGGTHLCNIRLM